MTCLGDKFSVLCTRMTVVLLIQVEYTEKYFGGIESVLLCQVYSYKRCTLRQVQLYIKKMPILGYSDHELFDKISSKMPYYTINTLVCYIMQL